MHAASCCHLQTFYTSSNLSLGDRNARPIPFTQSLAKGATNGILGVFFAQSLGLVRVLVWEGVWIPAASQLMHARMHWHTNASFSPCVVR